MIDRVWFISDTHFWHHNIIKYCNRPFADVAEMNTAMMTNWKSKVKQGDLTIHVGDVMFGGERNISQMNEWLAYIPGEVILIAGNHDFHDRKQKHLYNLNVSQVFRTIDFTHDGMSFRIQHYPMSQPELDEFVSGGYNIHGHIHNKLVENSSQHINACVEHHNYGPVTLQDLLFK